MDHQGEAISIFCEEKREASQIFSSLLDDLIRHVESRDFDPKVFNELYLELLSSTAKIFELEKASHGMERLSVDDQQGIPYGTFRAQLAKLNEACSEKGVSQSYLMLEFLLDWCSKRYDLSINEAEVRSIEVRFACA